MKKLIITSVSILFLLPLATSLYGQSDRYGYHNDDVPMWAIGASYEIRNEDPTTGFGLRIERELVPPQSAFKLGMRAHFSYFNESNNITEDDVTVDRDIEAYDFGIALLAGVEVAIIRPYVGFGVGTENFELESDNPDNNFNENNFFWNALGGLELAIIPGVRPFLEYRITRFTDSDEIEWDDVNRVAVGLNFRF